MARPIGRASRMIATLSLAAGAVLGGEPAAPAPAARRVETRVARVLLYSTGARVTRTGAASLGAGSQTLLLPALPPVLEPDSIRVALPGAPDARVASVSFSVAAESRYRQERADGIAAERARIAARVRALDDEIGVLAEERKVVHGIPIPDPFVPKEAKAPEPAAPLALDAWKAILGFSAEAIERASKAIREREREKEALLERDGVLQKEHEAISARSLPASGTVALAVERPAGAAPAESPVEVSYLVGGCAWFPAYELRFSRDRCALVEQALVGQNTGEDWTGVELSLSTSEPRRAVRIPAPRAWRIGEKRHVGLLEPLVPGQEEAGEEAISRAVAIPPPPVVLRDVGPFPAPPPVPVYEGSGSAVGGVDLASELGVPAGAYGSRDGGGRRNLVAVGGGSAGSESAVERSGRWAPAHQAADGGFHSLDLEGTADFADVETALILLSYLGSGYTDSQGKYADPVRRMLEFVISRADPSGAVGEDIFAQAVSALALAEAYGMGSPRAREPAERAIQALCERIREDPMVEVALLSDGFPNGPHNVAWVAMALKSAKLAGVAVPPEAFDRVLELVEAVEERPPTLAGLAATALSRVFLGERIDSPRVASAVETLLENGVYLKDLQHLYLATLLMFQAGPERWQKWNAAMRNPLVAQQRKDGDQNGSWDPVDVTGAKGGSPGAGTSRAYSTALCSMCLEVYYRYLPVYKGGGGGEGHEGPAGTSLARLGAAEGAAWRHPARSARGRDWRVPALGSPRVPSDGIYRPVPLARLEIPAAERWLAEPLVTRAVYRSAALANPNAGRPLLAGEARVFDGERLLGSTWLETVEGGKAFSIPLGPDPRVLAARQVRQEESKRGSRTKLEVAITLQVKNTSPELREIPVRLLDRHPVVLGKDVRLLDVRLSPGGRRADPEADGGGGGGGGAARPRTGRCEWELKVRPGEAAACALGYTVEYGSGIRLVPQSGAPIGEEGEDE